MSFESKITIDGFELTGTAVHIASFAHIVQKLLDELTANGGDDVWVPVAGSADEDTRVMYRVRLTRNSSVGIRYVEDGSFPEETFTEMHAAFRAASDALQKRFDDSEIDDESESGPASEPS